MSTDEYLDSISIEILRLFQKNPAYYNYNLSQIRVITNHGDHTLGPTIAFLRERNYLKIDPTYLALHPDEAEILRDGVAADTPLRITKEGLAALENAELIEKRHRINQKRDRITLAVSVATLIVSIATLIVTIVAMLGQSG